jgi:hypothetical protein
MQRGKVFAVLCLLTPGLSLRTLAQDVPRGAERVTIAPRHTDVRFTLTPTQNIWTFLLLDSNNGRVWQIHYSIADSAFAGRLPINEDVLTPPASAHIGRFALQDTQNTFNFLLLDQDDGRVWQIQWSYDKSKRGIVRALSPAVPGARRALPDSVF